MRELRVLRRLAESYLRLGLKPSRFWLTLALMLVSAVLEMGGLSILYPLVLTVGSAEGGVPPAVATLGRFLPVARDPRIAITLLFFAVGVVNVLKNVVLYYTYRHNIRFATYYGQRLISGLYSTRIQRSLLDFRRESSGSLVNVVCGQVKVVTDGVLRPLLVAATEFCLLAAICLVVLVLNPALIGALAVTCGLALGLYYGTSRDRALRWGQRELDTTTLLYELVGNTADGISEIKVFGKERELIAQVDRVAAERADFFQKLEMHNQMPRYMLESVFIATFAGLFAWVVNRGADLSGVLAQFAVVAAAALRLLPSANRLFGSYSNFSFHIAPALVLLDGVMEEVPASAVRDAGEAVVPAPELGAPFLAATDISFRYAAGAPPVLQGVSLTVLEGETVGIMGSSGSGKSTLIEILAGLYHPTTGRVLTEGRSIHDHPRWWHAAIGYVPQVPFIMPGTIRDNVAFGAERRPFSDQDIWSALERVGLSAFVSALPAGLDAPIGERGAGLSGGQRQLICLARALLRSPRVLLLDEPTAALDAGLEGRVMQTLRELPRETAVIMVSHKASNFVGFDTIYQCAGGVLTKATPALVSL